MIVSASSWLTTGEVAVLMSCSPESVRRLLADPQHAEFAGRVQRRGRARRFPAGLTWFYLCEGRVPDAGELAEFLQVRPFPLLERRGAQLQAAGGIH